MSGCATVVGVDASAAFLAGVRGAVRADVTALPLRDGCADVVYARFLLSHLPEPIVVANSWRRLLRRPHGVLVLEEPDAILTDDADVTAYLTLTTERVRAAGAEMYAGPLLAPLGGDVVALDVTAEDAARMFTLNLASWGGDEHRDLAARLRAKTETDGVVGWRLRQIVLDVGPD